MQAPSQKAAFNERAPNEAKKSPERVLVALAGDPSDPMAARAEIYEALLQAQSDLNEGVAITEGGRFVYANDALARLYGYSASELQGKPFLDLIAPEDRERIVDLVRRREAGEALPVRGHTTVVRKDGRRVHVEYAGTPLRVSGPARIVTIVRDVTEARRLQQEAERRTRDLQNLNQDLEHFVYAVSHDLKDPLHTIRGYLGLIERTFAKPLGSEGAELIGYARESADWMRTLIDGLLQYARLDVRRGPPEDVDLNEVLDRALDNLDSAIRDAGGQVARAELPTVKGDAAQLTQLFQNLVSNAVKFRSKARPLQVDIRAEREGGEWRLDVEDNGIGVAAGQQHRLFKIFQRLHTEQEYPGTGIGLALCRRIVELHGGRIGLESREGQGTTVSLRLPAA